MWRVRALALGLGVLGLAAVATLAGLGVFSSLTPSPSPHPPPPPALRFVETQLVMDATVDEFDQASRDRFKERLARHLDIDAADIRILEIVSTSVRVTAVIDVDAAGARDRIVERMNATPLQELTDVLGYTVERQETVLREGVAPASSPRAPPSLSPPPSPPLSPPPSSSPSPPPPPSSSPSPPPPPSSPPPSPSPLPAHPPSPPPAPPPSPPPPSPPPVLGDPDAWEVNVFPQESAQPYVQIVIDGEPMGPGGVLVAVGSEGGVYGVTRQGFVVPDGVEDLPVGQYLYFLSVGGYEGQQLQLYFNMPETDLVLPLHPPLVFVPGDFSPMIFHASTATR